MTEQLKPCPFCGSNNCVIGKWHPTDCYCVECQDCGAMSTECINKQYVIKAWNNRCPIKAVWVYYEQDDDDDEHRDWVCSNCHNSHTFHPNPEDDGFSFCPYCGALMTDCVHFTQLDNDDDCEEDDV